jgi:hypothetical protein
LRGSWGLPRMAMDITGNHAYRFAYRFGLSFQKR